MSDKLQMSLKGVWYEMTDPDKKREDYRLITPYWISRLTKKGSNFSVSHAEDGIEIDATFKPFKINVMTLGYPKSGDESRIKRFEHAGIEIRTGNPEWGAEPGKLYFVIKHGKRL